MRDSNHRSLTLNKPIVTITSTVYDRRALDINSSIPLINSLNYLTYLTSNSSKVRETVANDGALERLVSILRNCHLSLFELLDLDLEDFSEHDNIKNLWKEKKLALCAWKWTLTFQCLVLTGTRGTEQIRKKVVMSGVLSVLVTVLDNYLLYHKNYDFIKDQTMNFDFKGITTETMYKFLRKDENETYQQYIEFITGQDKLKLSNDKTFLNERLVAPSMTIPTDFSDTWVDFAHLASNFDTHTHHKKNDDDTDIDTDRNNTNFNAYEEFFSQPDVNKPTISTPREFFLGRIVPKQDDVIWSLQLLAFVSKYTYMKSTLQNVELVESLSFRSMATRVKQRISEDNDIEEQERNVTVKFSTLYPYLSKTSKNNPDHKNSDSSKDNPFFEELKKLSNKCQQKEQERMSNIRCPVLNLFERYRVPKPNDNNANNTDKERIILRKKLSEKFERNWNYEKMKKKSTNSINDFKSLSNIVNIFPLVEKYTVNTENTHDIIYWSSVIMRNSCRKNEILGVRQCANFSCGKWEDFPRQFAKCRRCKRTKYCSRKCQLKAWGYHRYWCHEVGSSHLRSTNTTTGVNTPNEPGSLNTTATTAADVSNSTSTFAPNISTTVPDEIGNADDNSIPE
ncbi:MYND-type zinc finger protein MUB1 [Saccharomyces eubayanus]|uniref:MYND-type zinc finger protein MUB1 n=1 Tax=Saccharomyces eubayanus TaxID=1080349 RepID=UPI0006C508A9|nr:MUB1-like protein [Saccharomyces eubayanus]KOG97439.1 MUB1-like protein [Saccharomyces eubayanus]